MSAVQSIYGSVELVQIAEAVAREKNIDKESVMEAMEQAIQIAGRRKYGHEHDIRAEIDRRSGAIKLFRVLLGHLLFYKCERMHELCSRNRCFFSSIICVRHLQRGKIFDRDGRIVAFELL